MTRGTPVDRDLASSFLSYVDHWPSYSPAHVLLLLTSGQIRLNTLLQGPKYSQVLLKNHHCPEWCQHQPEAHPLWLPVCPH